MNHHLKLKIVLSALMVANIASVAFPALSIHIQLIGIATNLIWLWEL